MLEPKKTKFRKFHKPKVRFESYERKELVPVFGSYGLKVVEGGRITARELEAARRVIAKRMKKRGSMWVLVFPDKSVTKKPAEVRMGKGKGSVDHWVSLVRGGKIIFEISGDSLNKEIAVGILKLAGQRISLKTKVVESKE